MQRLTRLLLACTWLLASGLAVAGDTTDLDRQARHLWYDGILSGYQALAREAQTFARVAGDYCQAPEQTTQAQVRDAWQRAFLAWQAVRFVDFGPVENDNRAWQFQFWPDPKNLVARKARALLTSGAPVTREQVEQGGVAVQGFPMAEYLLFDDAFGTSDQALPATSSCALLTAVAGHIADNSQQLLADWQAFRPHYLDTAQFRDTTLRAGVATLEILEERRLAQPMGLRGTGKRSVYVADAWRSGRSLAGIEASVRGLHQYFFPGLALLLEHSDQPELGPWIDAQFGEVLEHFPALRQPMAPLLAPEGHFGALQGLYVDLSQLAVLVNDQAAVALGVVRGFNSSDGD